MPVRMMRVVWAWPDPWRSRWKAFLSTYGLIGCFSALSLSCVLFLASGEWDNFVAVLGTIGDIMAGIVVMNKIYCLHLFKREVL